MKQSISAWSVEQRETSGWRYDNHYHPDWGRYQQLIAELGVVTEQRDRYRELTTLQRVREQTDPTESARRVNELLGQLGQALRQLDRDAETIVQTIASGYGYQPRVAATVVAVDARAGQLLHLLRSIEQDGGIQAPAPDASPHRYLIGDRYIEAERVAQGELEP